MEQICDSSLEYLDILQFQTTAVTFELKRKSFKMRYLSSSIISVALYVLSSECAPLVGNALRSNTQESKALSMEYNQSLSAVSNSSPLSCLTIPDISALDSCTLYTPDPCFDPTEPNSHPFQLMTGNGRYVLQASMKSDGMPFFLTTPDDSTSNPFLQIFAYNSNDKTLRLAIDNTFLLSLTNNSVLSLVRQQLIPQDSKNITTTYSTKGKLGPCALASQNTISIMQPVSVPPVAFFTSRNGTLLGSLTEDVSLAYDGSYELIAMPYRECICKGITIGGQLWQFAPVICDVDKTSMQM